MGGGGLVRDGRSSTRHWTASPAGRLALTAVLTGIVCAIALILVARGPANPVANLVPGVLIGVAVGVAARVGWRAAIAVALVSAAAVSAFGLEAPRPIVVLISVLLTCAEVLAVSGLLRRTAAGRLRDPMDTVRYGAIVLATAVGIGSLVATATWAVHGPAAQPWILGRAVAVGSAFGLTCVAPAILTISPLHLERRRSLWAFVGSTAYSVLMATVVFLVGPPGDLGAAGWPYLATLGAFVAALFLGVRAAAWQVLLVAMIALTATMAGLGVFAQVGATPADRLLVVQVFGIIFGSAALTLAVLRDARARALDQARRTGDLLAGIVDASPSVIFAKSFAGDLAGDGRYVLVNSAWEKAQGVPRSRALGATEADLFSPATAADYVREDHDVLRNGAPITLWSTGIGIGEQGVTYRIDKFPLRDDSGALWGVAGVAVDVTDALEMELRERRSAALLRAVFEMSPTPAVRLGVTGPATYSIVAANAAALALVGGGDGVGPDDLLAYVHEDDVPAVVELVESAASRRRVHEVLGTRREIRVRRRDGEIRWVLVSAAALLRPDEGPDEVIVQFEDVTARREAEEALTDQALRDQVTGLPNRRALNDRLRQAVSRLAHRGGIVAVLFCDLDRFKDVNDSIGHHAGDEVLVTVARALAGALRPGDSLARLGGDEFVVVGEDLADPADAAAMAARLQVRLRDCWNETTGPFRPTMSIGVATTDDPSMSPDELLRRADLAMYRAKDKGRDRVEVFDQGIDDALQRAVTVQLLLRQAIAAGSLELHYQPIVDLAERARIGAEALVRMRGSDGALLPPDEFIGQAESTGLIVPLGVWVVRRALADLPALDRVVPGLRVAVNVSPAQLRDVGFAAFLLSEIAAAGVSPDRIAVEVTETTLLHDPHRSAVELNALSEAGVCIALDDFGTGYSSLSWLTQFPVDVVKIDRSFSADVVVDERKAALVRAIASASETIGFSVLAEGIEGEAQLLRLRELGCHRGQGYLFGAPAPVDSDLWRPADPTV